jgi:hypothetical protein
MVFFKNEFQLYFYEIKYLYFCKEGYTGFWQWKLKIKENSFSRQEDDNSGNKQGSQVY